MKCYRTNKLVACTTREWRQCSYYTNKANPRTYKMETDATSLPRNDQVVSHSNSNSYTIAVSIQLTHIIIICNQDGYLTRNTVDSSSNITQIHYLDQLIPLPLSTTYSPATRNELPIERMLAFLESALLFHFWKISSIQIYPNMKHLN